MFPISTVIKTTKSSLPCRHPSHKSTSSVATKLLYIRKVKTCKKLIFLCTKMLAWNCSLTKSVILFSIGEINIIWFDRWCLGWGDERNCTELCLWLLYPISLDAKCPHDKYGRGTYIFMTWCHDTVCWPFWTNCHSRWTLLIDRKRVQSSTSWHANKDP